LRRAPAGIPVRAARKILSDSPHVLILLRRRRALRRRARYLLSVRNEDLIIPREVDRLRAYQAQHSDPAVMIFSRPEISHDMLSHDTVGAVALDRSGQYRGGDVDGGTLNKSSRPFLATPSLIGCAAMPIISAPPHPRQGGANRS